MPSVRPQRSISTAVPVIGILGGIGSGKSSVVRQVGSLKLRIIDADQIGHELLKTPPVMVQIRQIFGNTVFSDDGRIDRQRLADRVFGESNDHKLQLQKLQDILHPAIHSETCSRIQAATSDVQDPVDAVIWDAALLLEAGWADACDALIFIDTPLNVRRQRVQESRGWSAEELDRREAAQLSLQQKRAAADYVIDNSHSMEESTRQLDAVLSTIIRKHRPDG